MSVRKRRWETSKGEEKTAWVVDYVDQQSERHIKTFAKKKGCWVLSSAWMLSLGL